jgi:hypothetical protein
MKKKLAALEKKKKGYWPVQMNGNKFATGQILEKKTGRSCQGPDFSWLSSKVSQTLVGNTRVLDNFGPAISPDIGMGRANRYFQILGWFRV